MIPIDSQAVFFALVSQGFSPEAARAHISSGAAHSPLPMPSPALPPPATLVPKRKPWAPPSCSSLGALVIALAATDAADLHPDDRPIFLAARDAAVAAFRSTRPSAPTDVSSGITPMQSAKLDAAFDASPAGMVSGSKVTGAIQQFGVPVSEHGPSLVRAPLTSTANVALTPEETAKLDQAFQDGKLGTRVVMRGNVQQFGV